MTRLKYDSILHPTEKPISYEDALKECGFGKFQYKLILLGSLLILLVMNESMGMGYIMPAAQCDLNLTSQEKGLLSGMMIIGIITSAHFWGYMGDTRGRRVVIFWCLLLAALFTIASAFTNNLKILMLLRYFNGFFVSGVSSTSYAYIGEFITLKYRSTVISWISVPVGLSQLYLPILGWWILSYDWIVDIGFDFRPWRLLFLVYGFPGVLALIWLINFPESPRYLLTVNRETEALEILRQIYCENKNTSSTIGFSVKQLIPETNKNYKNFKDSSNGIGSILRSVWDQTMPLLKSPHLKYFTACCFMHFGTLSVSTGMGIWFPDIMNRLSVSDFYGYGHLKSDVKICEILDDAGAGDNKNSNSSGTRITECNDTIEQITINNGLILGLIYTICYILLSLLIKPLGRRTVFVITLFSSGLSGILLLQISNPILMVFLFIVFLTGCSLNVSVINGVAITVFPTHLRAMAVCISMVCGRIGGTLFANVIGLMLDVNCNATFNSLAFLALACGLVSFVLPP